MNQPALNLTYVVVILVLSLIYGVTFVTPIGGGDMPVVISLLNSFTGLGAALAGLIYGNQVMLVGGVLVGASGTILTILMCQAMNRSLMNVIIGGFSASGGGAAQTGEQVAKEATFVGHCHYDQICSKSDCGTWLWDGGSSGSAYGA